MASNIIQLDWQNCPKEILLTMFEVMDAQSLCSCMFVCYAWNEAAQYIANYKHRWQDIVSEFVVDRGSTTKLKSIDMNWRDVFINHLLWTHIRKATLSVKHVFRHEIVRNLHVYKDNLIVIHCEGVTYYNLGTGQIMRDIKLKCQNFEETDDIILKVTRSLYGSKTLHLYCKANISDFNIDPSNEMRVDRVMHFRLVKNHCYALDELNTLTLYTLLDNNWTVKHLSRYYGSNCATVDLNLFRDNLYTMSHSGDMLWSNGHGGFDKKVDVGLPTTEANTPVFIKMFHKYGVVFGVPNSLEYNFNRYDHGQDKVYVFNCPNVTCVTEHGEYIFTGYSDGTFKMCEPRAIIEESVLRYESSFTKITQNEEDSIVVAMDVFEEMGQNHLIISTCQNIVHMVFDHVNMNKYIWSQYPRKTSLKAYDCLD